MASDHKTKIFVVALLLVWVFSSPSNGAEVTQRTVILSTTTSTQDSGLLDVLIPLFEKQTGYSVKTVSVGTGQALALAAKGDADVALVHAPSLEKQYVAEGKLLNRRLVMYNDFVIIGPKEDPAKMRSAKSAVGALKAIEQAKASFVSRGDNSGTHVLEKSLWKSAGVEPKGAWYIEAGQGMGATLGIANERNAYTITDRGTYLALGQARQLADFDRRRQSALEYLFRHGSESRQRTAHQLGGRQGFRRFHGRATNPECDPQFRRREIRPIAFCSCRRQERGRARSLTWS